MAIHPGDILAGYRVVQRLGRGGMGEVWAAHSKEEGREVAIKVLLPNAALKPDLVARFEREAQVTASIQSDYVCKLLKHERDASGALLLVFEKLEGESLSQRIKREIYLPLAEVGPIVDDAFKGLTAAHRAGVIHRDLKPGNIFLERIDHETRSERAKVLDFGISKLTTKGRDEPSLTDFDATLGSFAYMAPEQVRGAARVDVRCDIYAMGAVAFRALAGRLPFEGSNAGIIIALKLDRPAPTLSDVTNEQWPAGLEGFLSKAMQRDPDDRFATAEQALREWRSIQPEAIAIRARQARPATKMRTAEQLGQYDGQPTVTEVTSAVDRWEDFLPPNSAADGEPDPAD